jgi:hypothetical protein
MEQKPVGSSVSGSFLGRFLSTSKIKTIQGSSPNKYIGELNPSSNKVFIREDKLVFKCPTCPGEVTVSLNKIDAIVGITVQCPTYKNLAHVPGAFKIIVNPSGVRIIGGVHITIAKFGEWWYSHPLVDTLTKYNQINLLNDYSLWATCAECYHNYQPTVLFCLPRAQKSRNFEFNPRTPESALDMQSLRSGHCPSCNHNSLIAILADIPVYVSTYIETIRHNTV